MAVDVVAVDKQRRRHLQQLARGIRFGQQHAGDAQRAAAEFDVVADAHAQRIQQARIGVGLAARRRTGGAGIEAGGVAGHAQLAAQRITVVDALHRGHLAGLAVEEHAGEGDDARAAQAAAARFHGELHGRVLAPAHAEVAADHLGGAGGQRQVDPVDQGADRGHRRHAQHQRGDHGQQVAGEEFAAQRTHGMAQHVHARGPGTKACRRPPSRR